MLTTPKMILGKAAPRQEQGMRALIEQEAEDVLLLALDVEQVLLRPLGPVAARERQAAHKQSTCCAAPRRCQKEREGWRGRGGSGTTSACLRAMWRTDTTEPRVRRDQS